MDDIQERSDITGAFVAEANFITAALTILRSAKSDIRISTFKLEIQGKGVPRRVKKLFDEIKKAIERKIIVRCLVNYRDSAAGVPRSNLANALTLRSAGVGVRYLSSGRCIHSKVIIADGKIMLIGSHNLSVRSLTSNLEASVVVSDPGTVRDVAGWFDVAYEKSQDF